MIKTRFNNRRFGDFESEDVNPMDGVANMTDVMLVIAVGIMLALVVAWNVDLNKYNNEEYISSKELKLIEKDVNSVVMDIDGKDSIKDLGLEEKGVVYKDKDGNMYIIEKGMEK